MSVTDEHVCARCGTPAGSAWFCRTCGLNLAAEKELPSRAEWEAEHPDGWTDKRVFAVAEPASPARPASSAPRSSPRFVAPRPPGRPAPVRPAPAAFGRPAQGMNPVYWLAFVGLALSGIAFAVYAANALTWINDVNVILTNLSTGTLTEAELVAGNNAQSAVNGALLLVYGGLFVAGICFLIWFVSAYRRMAERGANLRFSAGWALGSWFVPFLNYVRPKQITNDLWRAASRDSWVSLTLVNWWWGLYLASSWVFAIGVVVSRNKSSGDTAQQLLSAQKTGFWISILGCLIYLAAGVLAAIIAWRISQPED